MPAAGDPAAAEPLPLTPTVVDLDEALQSWETLQQEAEAILVALARAQNRWGEAVGLPAGGASCGVSGEVSLALRSRALGAGARDRLQSSRAQRQRTERLAGAATVQPLLRSDQQRLLEDLAQRVDGAVTAWRVASGYQRHHMEPWLAACGPSAELTAAPGLASPLPEARPRSSMVAVIALEGGVLCPGSEPSPSGVAVLRGPSCWSADEPCACDPIIQLPAAVLGPSHRTGDPP